MIRLYKCKIVISIGKNKRLFISKGAREELEIILPKYTSVIWGMDLVTNRIHVTPIKECGVGRKYRLGSIYAPEVFEQLDLLVGVRSIPLRIEHNSLSFDALQALIPKLK